MEDSRKVPDFPTMHREDDWPRWTLEEIQAAAKKFWDSLETLETPHGTLRYVDHPLLGERIEDIS